VPLDYTALSKQTELAKNKFDINIKPVTKLADDNLEIAALANNQVPPEPPIQDELPEPSLVQ
jgi:hypothetical protein